MKYFCAALAVALMATGAVAKKPAMEPDSQVAFDPAEASWASIPGANKIAGNALLRTVGGDVRTCAGFTANLIPVTRYGADRVRIIYGTELGGFHPSRTDRSVAPARPEYSAIAKSVTCDAQGDFEFNDLADGEYYVQSQVTWGVPTRYFTRVEGGLLIQRVRVEGGETKRIVLTAQ
ncbi:hypothetical protein K9B33_20900 [Sphingobium sp. 3R8]|uniref:hypothetical protein n=1 Tax=Sphingobium sp. 3R8 TaxID=2874921 RepID=UPI001CCA3FF4|nr:hypothetical protein [Sphingobium sp. 3R8]MBZ9649997.1 hypothetical protein [Sphingobium sp. 3R8]